MAGTRAAVIAAIAVVGSLVIVPLAHADAPSNDNLADAAPVESLAFDADVDLTEATVEAGEPDCYGWAASPPPSQSAVGAAAPTRRPDPLVLGLKASHEDPSGSTTNTVWYSYEAAEDLRIVVDTLGSGDDQDTVLAVYEESTFGLTSVACNDDANSLNSRVVFDAHAGHRYLIQLGAYYGSATSARLHMDVAPPPGVISGTVTDDDTGEPVADVCIDVFGDQSYGWDVTDADGTYAVLADPGDVRVTFSDCSWWYEDEWHYESEYYDDVQLYEDATILALAPGAEISEVDAGLTLTQGNPWSGSDLAITGLEIEHAALRVDGAAAPVGPGTSRVVGVEVANVGTRVGSGTVNVSICPVTSPSSCQYLDAQYVDLDESEAQSLTFDWNGIGTIGDVTVTAVVDSCDFGGDWENNEMSRRDYVTIGGTGVGVGAPNGWPEDHWGCGYVIAAAGSTS